MMQLKKGHTYLAMVRQTETYKTGWIIYQTGMKTWEATVFTHHTRRYGDAIKHITGNSLGLVEKLEALAMVGKGVVEIRQFKDTAMMRRVMFNVLKRGEFDDEKI